MKTLLQNSEYHKQFFPRDTSAHPRHTVSGIPRGIVNLSGSHAGWQSCRMNTPDVTTKYKGSVNFQAKDVVIRSYRLLLVSLCNR